MVFAEESTVARLPCCARREGLRDFGAAMSPHNAFAILQGIETLGLRMDRHVANTRKVADFLLAHDAVEKVVYPELPDHPDHALAQRLLPKGCGAVLTFDLKGGRAGKRFIDSLQLFSHLANVGDAKSLAIHPASTTHFRVPAEQLAQAGISVGTMRLSVGLEDADDLLEDLARASNCRRKEAEMLLEVQGHSAYCYTGGKPLDTSLPAIVFIHGAQNDHSVWALQSRYFAHHGYAVLASICPATAAAAGRRWLPCPPWRMAAGAARCGGHTAGRPVRPQHGIADRAGSQPSGARAGQPPGAAGQHLSDEGLASAAGHGNDEASAIDMVNIYSHASLTGRSASPGVNTTGVAQRLMQRMSAINPQQLFFTDFTACNEYANGAAAAQAVQCPTLLLCGARDMMTPPKSARLLASSIAHARTVTVNSGHSLMSEQPDAVLDHLLTFMQS
jgi:pimeloyl-ACP methyl ester carboxylesterase